MKRVVVQLRNVPPKLRRRLEARLAAERISVSDFVMREVRKALDRPTRPEVLEGIRKRDAVELRASPADVIRSERDSR